jgi:hypothetical protein
MTIDSHQASHGQRRQIRSTAGARCIPIKRSCGDSQASEALGEIAQSYRVSAKTISRLQEVQA